MGHKAKRPIARPRKAALPDPTGPALRRWVIDLTPERMHREVRARLRGRAALEQEAIATWTFAGFPGWPEDQPEAPLSLRLRLAERLTITSPMVRLEFSRIPLLPFGHVTQSAPVPPAPNIPRPGEGYVRELIARFSHALIHEWWKPLTHHAPLLAEYQALYAALRSWRPADGRLWHALYTRAGSSQEIRIDGHPYRLPRLKALAREGKAPPSRVAVHLLAHNRGINRTVLNAELHSLRLEARIAAAWARYAQWLTNRPPARAELDQVLATVTRDRSRPNPSLPGAPPLDQPVRHTA